MKKLVIATRRSKLALWQSEFVKSELLKHYPDMEITLQEFVTKGDKIQIIGTNLSFTFNLVKRPKAYKPKRGP